MKTGGRLNFFLNLFAGALLVGAYSHLLWAAPARPASPDESANAFFAQVFAVRTRLTVTEPLNAVAGGLIHPRSIRAIGDRLAPGGFFGWPLLLGAAGKVAGRAAMPYAGVALCVLAVFAWGGLMSRFFGRRIGLLAGMLLAIQPAWWYWSSRPFMANAGFTALIIIAAWWFFAMPLREFFGHQKKIAVGGFLGPVDAAVAGALLSLAFAVRMSEAYWLALGILAAVAVAGRSVPWKRLIVFAFVALLAAAPFILLNLSIYGRAFASGYGQEAFAVPVDALPQGGGAALLGPLRPLLFPLGFAPRTALARFWEYGALGMPIWSLLLAAAGILALYLHFRNSKLSPYAEASGDRPNLKTPAPSAWRPYLAAAAAISVWLIMFYGSYAVQDFSATGPVTLGLSYYRYWLPIFVFATAPIAWFLAELTAGFSGIRPFLILSPAIIALAVLSAWQVFGAPGEGLLDLGRTLTRNDAETREIVARTELDAVIVCDQADKLIFPERRVITPLRSDATYAALGTLEGIVPLYYYGVTLPPADLNFLRDVRLKPYGLEFEPVRSFSLETLYRIQPVGGGL